MVMGFKVNASIGVLKMAFTQMQCSDCLEGAKERVFILASSSVNVRVSTFKYFSVYFWGNGAETCSPPAVFPVFEFF